MPASLPGETLINNLTEDAPAAGMPVIFDLLSGQFDGALDTDRNDNAGVAETASTGALSTGLGIGPNMSIRPADNLHFPANYTPGVTKPDGTAGNSTMMYIGGGRSYKDGDPSHKDGVANANPYTTGYGIGGAGNGAMRDTPDCTVAYKPATGGAKANGAELANDVHNRTGVTVPQNQYAMGVYEAP